MTLPTELVLWLNEGDPEDRIEFHQISSRILDRLREQGSSQEEIDHAFRLLAPLEFHEVHSGASPWNCFFAPKFPAEEGRSEFPNLALLAQEHVDAWAQVAESTKHLKIKARFADSIWELGKKAGSTRKDLHRFGRMASESHLNMGGSTTNHPFELINSLARSIQLAMQLGATDLVNRGFENLMRFADSVEQAHVGLWCAPFDRLLNVSGLSDAQRERILERHSQRFAATVASGDIFRISVVGPEFAKYFYDRQQYQRAKDITFAYGEAILESAAPLEALLAVHHIEGVLEAYRRIGLKDETDRVRLLLEERGKGMLAGLKSHRVEVKLDLDVVEAGIDEALNVSSPLVALYRLVNGCAPHPERLREEFEAATEGLIAHRLLPVSIIGDDGLTVTTIGTYDQDKEGCLTMQLAREMGFNATIFLSGIEEWKKKFELGGIPDTPALFDSLLIPPDRVALYREGLEAFEKGDYLKCIHVLVFQVENSLRELLKLLGRPVTKSTEEGNQPKNMNDVLHDPAVKVALDPKLWSFLKVLYTDNRGVNLRNLLAHGVAPASAFNRINAALVVQSVLLLAAVREDALVFQEDRVKPPQSERRTTEEEEARSVDYLFEAAEDANCSTVSDQLD